MIKHSKIIVTCDCCGNEIEGKSGVQTDLNGFMAGNTLAVLKGALVPKAGLGVRSEDPTVLHLCGTCYQSAREWFVKRKLEKREAVGQT